MRTIERRKTGLVLSLVLAAMLVGTVAWAGCSEDEVTAETLPQATASPIEKIVRTEEEWKGILPPERYEILREKGTEPPTSGEYDDHWEDGTYVCYACELPLFDSTAKFHSGTGWPSFWQPIAPENVEEHADSSFGMARVEVTCARCGGHLGHVFTDGPEPTGLRYCINSLALQFVPR